MKDSGGITMEYNNEKDSNLLYQQRIWGHGYRKGKAQGYDNGFDDGWKDGAITATGIATGVVVSIIAIAVAVGSLFQQEDKK